MRVLLTADWQIGAGADLGTGEHGPGSRFQDQVDILNRIVDLAIEEKVGLFVMAGDAFERARPAPQEILAVQAVVRRLLAEHIRCLFLMGNHDSRGSALPSALEIFATSGCVVALAPSLYPLEAIDPDDPGVVVAALPWTPPGAIVAAMPDVARDDVNDAAAQALVAGARALREQCSVLAPTMTPILVGHWAVSSAALPTGLDTALLREPVIPLEGLTESGFALAMLGHIHRAQMLATGPCPVGYTGSPQVNTWGETEGDHGVWLFDSIAHGLEFIPIADNKRFVTLDADLTSADTSGLLYVDLGYSANGIDFTDAFVRARYTVTEAQARRVNQTAIRQSLADLGALKVIFKPTIVREERARVAEMASDSLSETQALDFWIASQQIDNGLAAQLHDAHAAYLGRV